MRLQVSAVVVALQFLTTCPPILKRLFQPGELGRAVGYFPLIGAAIGLLLAGLGALLGLVFPGTVVAALLIVAWVIGTGSLHVDGFLDACDGLLGGYTPDDRLRIMRDERVGGFALSGGLLLFLTKYASLTALAGNAAALVLAPVLGRWAMSMSIVLFPYARDKGLGRDMKDHAGRLQLALSTIIAAAVALLTGPLQGLTALAVAAIVTWAIARFALQRIPGLTGDIYGAMCEIVEACVLLTCVALVSGS
jgi:adenosylcobinamide-GDP ribazoletransferase